jgi:hypothetical protein
MEGKSDNNGHYNLMLHLERLESLQEDMEELGIDSLEALKRQIEEVHRQLDEAEA